MRRYVVTSEKDGVGETVLDRNGLGFGLLGGHGGSLVDDGSGGRGSVHEVEVRGRDWRVEVAHLVIRDAVAAQRAQQAVANGVDDCDAGIARLFELESDVQGFFDLPVAVSQAEPHHAHDGSGLEDLDTLERSWVDEVALVLNDHGEVVGFAVHRAASSRFVPSCASYESRAGSQSLDVSKIPSMRAACCTRSTIAAGIRPSVPSGLA